MSNRLTLLTGGARDRPTRQQTLRGAIDWSYSLLNPAEEVLFARLSVFAGGWTFEAAETVCDRDGKLNLLDGMASVVDGSLLRQEGEDEPRFSMLETIREYAGEKLEERGEGEEIRAAHARHFLDLTDEANRHLHGPEQVRWLDRLERDHDNLRAALRWAIERVETDLALRLAQSLSNFWYWRGHYSEGRATGTAILGLPHARSVILRGSPIPSTTSDCSPWKPTRISTQPGRSTNPAWRSTDRSATAGWLAWCFPNGSAELLMTLSGSL